MLEQYSTQFLLAFEGAEVTVEKEELAGFQFVDSTTASLRLR